MKEEVIVPKSSHVEEPPHDPFIEWYTSVATDCIHKATVATVLFFICWPWAALFWPPYYFVRRRSH